MEYFESDKSNFLNKKYYDELSQNEREFDNDDIEIIMPKTILKTILKPTKKKAITDKNYDKENKEIIIIGKKRKKS